VEPIAVVIPVYNQPDRLREVARRCLDVHPRVLIVDDGSDADVAPLVADLPVEVLRHEVNQGKGAAIRTAARRLREQEATHLVALDADGQHDPEDLPRLIAAIRTHPKALIIGVRDFDSVAVPGSSRFGRAFGNFWVCLQTGTRVHDIQSGFRAYPVALIEAMSCLTHGYAFEVEVVVRALWGGVPVQEVPVRVYYAPAHRRGSHFHKLWDNLRLTAVNTHLTIRAFIPWPHRQFTGASPRTSVTVWHPLRSIRMLLGERATPRELMFAVALGVFLGAVPLIACHTLAILIVAAVLRLNRVVAVAASQLCMPPVVPAVCIEAGHLLRYGRFLTLEGIQNAGDASFVQLGYMGLQCLWDWCIGSLPVGATLALLLGLMTYVTARTLQRVRHGF
jgi:glycosyltransferase involved in cell wall biosynthesis